MSKRVFQIVLLAVIVIALTLPAQAQKTASSGPQKTSGASATCDGALDIVPAKSMSFARKRRPNSASKGDAKPQSAPATEAKTQPKPSGN